jgi:hypothetical protein
MCTDFDKQLMITFLERNYPISRIKVNFKFRRGIVLEKGVYLLHDKSSRIFLKVELIKILKTVFSCDESICAKVSSNFLNLP